MFRICVPKCVLHKPLYLQSASVYQIHNLHWKGHFSKNFKIIKHFSTKVHDEKDCIYYGPLTPQIKAVKVFSLTSSAAGILAQPVVIKEAATIGSTSLIIAICSVIGFFTFVTPLLLHLITKKYVTRLHFDPETSTYTAVKLNLFLAQKQMDFKPDDVQVPEIPGMFTTFLAKGTPLFVDAKHFRDPYHYAKIMGYDKPIDFKLKQSDSESSK